MRYIDIACRALVALVFLWSATSKLRGRAGLNAFADSLVAFLPAGSRLMSPIAVAVALTELAVVPLVAIPATARVGSVLAAALLATFTVAIAVTVRRGCWR